MAFGFFMVFVPFVVENVSLKLLLCIFNLLNFFLELILLLKLFKFVALVVASGPFSGTCPQAYPTESSFAKDAIHPSAPLIFLYKQFAIRAGLSIGLDPVYI